MAELNLHIDGAEGASFRVHRFSLQERSNEPFSLSIIAGSTRADLDLDAMILQPASFSLDAGWAFVRRGGARTWTGVCTGAEQLSAETAGLSLYSLRLAPRFALLGLRRSYRIFQHLRIPAILGKLLDPFGIPHERRLDEEAFPVLDTKAQYGETDLVFFTRLCEEAGITFFFVDDEAQGSLVVLSDAPANAPRREGDPLRFASDPAGAGEGEHVTAVRLSREAHPLSVAVRDFDFRNPALALSGRTASGGDLAGLLEQAHFEPGALRLVTGGSSATPLADRRGAVRHLPRHGEVHTARLLTGERAAAGAISFITNAFDLSPGSIFSIEGHPHPTLGRDARLLVTKLSIEGERDEAWVARGKAVSAERPYSPARRTPRPAIAGLQSAVVTGPAGEEVFTDEHGRVKVRFLWDLADTEGEESSTWIRVSQGWAGAGYGLWTLPRVGQEVLVGFLEGNPDEPVIVGRAPNAHNPAPYPLPAGATKAVWRSRSTPGAEGYNELSFEDQAGKERFFQRAQKDMETVVQGDESLAVGGGRRHAVSGDEDVSIGGVLRERTGGALHLTTGGERRSNVGGDESLLVGGDRLEHASGLWTAGADGAIHLRSGQSIVIEAPDITLKGAGGFVRVGPGGVTTPGGWVIIQPGGPGAGPGGDPAVAELPGLGGSEAPSAPKPVRRLPLFGFGPVFPGTLMPGVEVEKLILCEAMCQCKDVRIGMDGKGPNRQNCVAAKMRERDRLLRGVNTIKPEVSYDMSQDPPAPIMSNNEPWRASGRPRLGTKRPDIVIVKDPSKPPTQDNIKRVIEMKFPGDKQPADQIDDYEEIAGPGARVDVMTLDDCGCIDEDPERIRIPVPVQQRQPKVSPAPKPGTLTPAQIEALKVIAVILALLADDVTGAGFADDAAILPLLARLGQLLGA
ncbi:MAG: type VI secretion system tip protein TssI/VgrG [Minicystis sp.]